MARTFNGTSDQIAADAAAQYSNAAAFSVSFWVKAAAAAQGHVVFSEGLSSLSQTFCYFQTNSAKLMAVGRYNNTLYLSPSTTATVFDSTWHHAIYAQGASRDYQFYVDGVADASGTFSSVTAFTADRVGMGVLRYFSGTFGFLAGTLAEVATFSRKLTAGEAQSLASGLLASHLGPTHYWPLWGIDSPEPDIGNG